MKCITHLVWFGIVDISCTDIRAERSDPEVLSNAAAAHEDAEPLLLAAIKEAQGSKLRAES